MIYAMSDFHGHLNEFRSNLEKIDLSGHNRLVLLGDYIDRGPASGQCLRTAMELQQQYGPEKVIALKGNHEVDFLEWFFGTMNAQDYNEYDHWQDWLRMDRDYQTFRSLVSPEKLEEVRALRQKLDAQNAWEDPGSNAAWALNKLAQERIWSENRALMLWLRDLPLFYETETQIFVHAGVDEEAGEYWKLGTVEEMFTGKFPASQGKFYKDVIAGHVPTSNLAHDRNFHGVWHDGQSHWYIDGGVYNHGRIPILCYDEDAKTYTELLREECCE